jgi:hypothetical protein
VSESEMGLNCLYTPPFFSTTEKGFEKTFDIKFETRGFKTVNHAYHSII